MKLSLRLASVVMLVAVWEFLGRAVDSLLLPTFLETCHALIRLSVSRELWSAMWLSNQALVLGFVLAVVVGIPLGVGVARWRLAHQIANPYLNVVLVTPVAAAFPLFIMAFGVGLLSRVLAVFVFAFPYVVLNTSTGIRSVDRRLVDMALSYGANERRLWCRVLLPGAVPAIAAGLRLALGRAVTGMVIVELLLVAVGVGQLILTYRGDFDAASVYAVIVVVVAEAVLLMGLANRIEKQWPSSDGVVV